MVARCLDLFESSGSESVSVDSKSENQRVMKILSHLSALVVVLLVLAVDCIAQSPVKMIFQPSTSKSEATIAIEVVNPSIKRIRIDGPSLKTPLTFNTTDSQTFFAQVALADKEGVNKFNVIGLDADENIVFITNQALRITRTAATPGQDDGANAQGGGKKPDSEKEPGGSAKKAALKVANLSDKQTTIVDEPYISLSIVPDLDLEKTKAKFFEVIVISEKKKNGSQERMPTEFSISSTENKANSPQNVRVKLFSGENTVEINLLDANKNKIEGIQTSAKVKCDPCETKYRNINVRAIAGLEQAGASSAASTTLPFLNLYVSVPLTFTSPGRSPKLAIWSDFRLTGSTVQNFANLTSISTNVLSNISTPGSSVNNVVQSFRFTGGLEYKIIPEKSLNSFFIPGKSSLSLIAGGGMTTPLNTPQQSAQIFKIPKLANGSIDPVFAGLFPDTDFTGKNNVAFVVPERDRFFRRWFVGARIKHSFYENRNEPLDLTPAMLDVTFGQDESITKKLVGRVLTFEGMTPFPIDGLDYIYLFGGMSMRLTRKVNSNVPKFFLQNADIINLTNNTDTVLISAEANPLTLSNRDTFRFGIGVDLIRLFRTARSTSKP